MFANAIALVCFYNAECILSAIANFLSTRWEGERHGGMGGVNFDAFGGCVPIFLNR